jgi:hypothetical protein
LSPSPARRPADKVANGDDEDDPRNLHVLEYAKGREISKDNYFKDNISNRYGTATPVPSAAAVFGPVLGPPGARLSSHRLQTAH